MRRFNCGLLVVGLLALPLVAGCGAPSADVIDTEPVQGLVTLDGAPVEGATVMFAPVTKGQGTSATGYTDASGIYKLTAQPGGGKKGAAEAGTTPGKYFVSVTKVEVLGLKTEEDEDKGIEEEASEESARSDPDMKYVVPEKYNLPRESGIEVEVKAGENDIPLELTSG